MPGLESQIGALDRSQPVLPIMPGRPERRTHDEVSGVSRPTRVGGNRFRESDAGIPASSRVLPPS